MSDPRTEPDGAPADGADQSPAIELESPPARRNTQGVRLRRAALVALVSLVAGAVLAREVGLTRPQETALTSTPPGPAVLISNVTFGSVKLNGAPLPGSPPLVLPLRAGANTITLDARPFKPRTCHLTWGAQGLVNSGNCPMSGPDQLNTITINGLVQQPSTLIAMAFTGDDLPADTYISARAEVARELAAATGFSLTVPVGEPIATGGHWPDAITSHVAGALVQGALSFGLYDDASTAPRRQSCVGALCAGAFFYTSASANVAPVWNTAPAAYYVWNFWNTHASAADGATSLPYPVSPPVNVPLTYDAALGWQPLTARLSNGYPVPLGALLDGTLCDAGIYALNALVPRIRGDIATVVRNSGPFGCVIALQMQTLGHDGNFIWRFGVLLAADIEAHDTLPALPIATAAEIAEVGG
jgi:hypothetical protein